MYKTCFKLNKNDFISFNNLRYKMSYPEPERSMIINTVKNMIDEFNESNGLDNKELLFKNVLDYLITKPYFVNTYNRFYNTVLKTIRKNQLLSHCARTGNNSISENEINHWELINPSPVINYNFYYDYFRNLRA